VKVSGRRLALARELQPRIVEATKKADALGIVRVLTDPRIVRVEFEAGKTYRLAVYGGPPIPTESTPETAKIPLELIDALLGMDTAGTMESAGLVEITGTYRGRRPSPPAFPHSFRMPDGRDAVLADMDLVGWEPR
jgi:hypothetical protein